MSRTAPQSEKDVECPGWYVEFLAAVLRQLPRPGETLEEITKRIAEEWMSNQEYLKKRLARALLFIDMDDNLKIATAPFDPATFIKKGWQEVTQERDERSAKLIEVDFAKARFIHCLKEGETSINGEEFLHRLKEASDIRLGATVFMGLWNDYQDKGKNSVIEHLYQDGKIKNWLYFFGTILLGPDGGRSVLYLSRRDDGEWYWNMHWIKGDWNAKDLSAVLS